MRYTKYYAALRVEENEEDTHYNFQNTPNQRHDFDDDDDPEEDIKIYIIGPASLAFPCNEGWTPARQHPDPQYQITELAHLTIKRITKLFTHFDIIKNARPNCVANWQARVGNINIDKIWPTLGTPLSDATQEKNWRKALHRAIFTRNRDSKRIKAGDTKCRLSCGCEESQLHLLECKHIRTYWIMVIKFITNVLKEPAGQKIVSTLR